MCEVAVVKTNSDLKAKCKFWKQQSYVRSILGIKLYDILATRNAGVVDILIKSNICIVLIVDFFLLCLFLITEFGIV